MKTFLITFSITLLLCFGIANADGITVSNFDGGWDNNTKVMTGRPVTWTIRVDTPEEGLTWLINGFRVFLSGNGTVEDILVPGSGFTPINFTTIINPWYYGFTSWFELEFGVDGIGADTVGFYGKSSCFGGPRLHIHENTWEITTQVDDNTIGNYLCLDSSFFPRGGPWLWIAYPHVNIIPSWDGPHCYLIETPACHLRGDANHDGNVFVDDYLLLRDHIFYGGPAPISPEEGDVTGDGNLNINDLVFIIDYLFKGGDAPPLCE